MQHPAHAAGFARGALALALRQGLSAGLAALGLLLIARIIGSEAFGVYVAAQAYVLVAAALAQLGLGLAIVRMEIEPSRGQLDTAWLLLAGSGFIAAAVGWIAAAWLLPGPGLESTRSAIAAMLAIQVVSLPSLIPLAQLERRMRFGTIAMIELAGQGIWLVVGFALARSAGPWALPAAWAVQQVAQAAAWHVLAGHRPGLTWSSEAARGLLGFGVSYAAAVASWQLRPLAAPTILAPFLGNSAVGQAGMTGRLIETLSLARHAVWRAGAPLLSRLVADPSATARAVVAGGAAAAAATALLCAVVVLVREPLLHLLGASWASALDLFPAFAAASLVAALTTLVPLALHVRGLSLRVAIGNLAHVGVLALVGWWAVPHHGLAGWALAEVASAGTFVGMVLLCPSDLRRALRGLLPPFLLLPAVGWFLFQPDRISLAVALAGIGGLSWMAWRHWRMLRDAP